MQIDKVKRQLLRYLQIVLALEENSSAVTPKLKTVLTVYSALINITSYFACSLRMPLESSCALSLGDTALQITPLLLK